MFVNNDDELILISQQGMILRTRAEDIRAIGRATQGVRLIEMEEGDFVVGVAKLAEKKTKPARTAKKAPYQSPAEQVPNPSRRARTYAGLKLCETGQQLFDTDAVETDGHLQVVVVLLDPHDGADAELRMAHAHPGSDGR